MARPGCEIPGCTEPHHANGLCRQHDDDRRYAAKQGKPSQAEYEDTQLRLWLREWLTGNQCGRSLFGKVAPWAHHSVPCFGGPRVTGWKGEAREEICADWERHGEDVLAHVERRISEGKLPEDFTPKGQRVAEGEWPVPVWGEDYTFLLHQLANGGA